jgi:hypothetical protein
MRVFVAHAGKPDFRHFDRFAATTNRLRTEGTDHLLAAAEATGVSRVVRQGAQYLDARRPRRADPDDPHRAEPRQEHVAAVGEPGRALTGAQAECA